MNVIWLGQAGLLFDFDGVKVMVDPYLSNSVVKVNPKNYRRQPIDARFFDVRPDVLLLTHDHLDHTDPETLEVLFKKHDGITVLASGNACQTAKKFGGENNYVQFDRGTQWTEKGVVFEAVHAEHSDSRAIGAFITYGGKTYYITGDTLYNKTVLTDIDRPVDVLFLPINGVGNNMNMTDAARFAAAVDAEKVVPLHFGMFDALDPTDFASDRRVIPTIYKGIPL